MMRRMRAVSLILIAVATWGCGGSSAGDGADARAGGGIDAAGGDGGASDGAPADAVPPRPCTFDDPRAPGAGVLWAAPLAGTGDMTLGGHGHNDSFGPVGWCAGTKVAGQPFFRLIAAGFETDTDIDNDGDQADALPVDFWRNPSTFTGYGESAGRVNIYIDVVDEQGNVLNIDSNPELKFVRTIKDGPVDTFPLTSKPANEFQTNFNMTGGGTRYQVGIDGASDQVVNMLLSVNHHVTYELIFRREAP